MANVYKEFEGLVEQALENQISRDGKLILFGRIEESIIRGDIIPKEGKALQQRLGTIEGLSEALNFALIGFPD